MMAAIAAAGQGHRVHLLEAKEKLGRKIYITGKGRCNVTNACSQEEFFSQIVSNEKFLYSSFYGFDNRAVMDFLKEPAALSRWKEEIVYFPFQIILRM